MKTRCPGCATRYEIDAEAALAADGFAQCLRCGTVFDTVSEQPGDAQAIASQSSSPPLRLDESCVAGSREAAERELPFDVPDDLPPLEASPDDALDVAGMLYEEPSYRGLVYGLLATLLLLALGTQLAWQYRAMLLERFPQLEIVCEYMSCRPEVVHEPHRYQVVQREIRPTENQTGSLTLNATIRNDAQIAQHLPDIQLSLIDNNGAILVRRRLAPSEYLFPPPPKDKVVQAGEVFTIGIDFEDPGHIASGFSIEFF